MKDDVKVVRVRNLKGTSMPKVLEEILESFYAALSNADAVNKPTLDELRTLFASERTLKADDFVAIFERTTEETSHDSD